MICLCQTHIYIPFKLTTCLVAGTHHRLTDKNNTHHSLNVVTVTKNPENYVNDNDNPYNSIKITVFW